MTALATASDVEIALAASGRAPTTKDPNNIDYLLETASDLVAAYLGGRPDPVPPEVTRVVADVVVAVLTKPATTTADYGAGSYYQQREVTAVTISPEAPNTTIGPFLSKAQKARLRQFRMGYAGRLAYQIDLGGSDYYPDGGWEPVDPQEVSVTTLTGVTATPGSP